MPRENRIAYICDGYDTHCSMAPYCFMRGDLVSENEMICHHTLNPDHAKNGICEDPEHDDRFVKYQECEWDDDPRYYELMPGEKI